MRNRKAQVGDTITWVIATIIIVVMILFFVFGSSLLAETKEVHKFKSRMVSEDSRVNYDLILSKSLYTYFKIEKVKSQNQFYEELEKMELQEKFYDSVEERKKEIQRGFFG